MNTNIDHPTPEALRKNMSSSRDHEPTTGSALERVALDFHTDMTRVSAPVIRLGVIKRVRNGWDYAWKRDRLELDEVALCNLETWPELGRDLSKFMQRAIERFADHGLSAWGYSALQLVPLSSAKQVDREGSRDDQ